MEKFLGQSEAAKVCLIELGKLDIEMIKEVAIKFKDPAVEEVKYYNTDPQAPKNQFHAGYRGVISEASGRDKKSVGHFNCFSVLVFGDVDGEPVSILAHINSSIFKWQNYEDIINELISRSKFVQVSNPKSFEVCLLAGDGIEEKHFGDPDYQGFIDRITNIFKRQLNVKVRKLDEGVDKASQRNGKHILVETKTRRIFEVFDPF